TPFFNFRLRKSKNKKFFLGGGKTKPPFSLRGGWGVIFKKRVFFFPPGGPEKNIFFCGEGVKNFCFFPR
ncbi:hypothetical protein, partial [Actinobacillus pleuropneumoniae]|uniref:hypothetical protein n=1 Tax=Actinobacillus pleuropneumoniae TaxID=715 RepID=UPI00238122DE